MDYSSSLDFLYQRLPMFQRTGKAALKPDLSNTIKLLERLGNPEKKFKTVHIAGTNGKGTSAHALAAILQSSGLKTGLYTSPHLVNFTERIKIDGIEINSDDVAEFVTKMKSHIEEIAPSFFEVTVAMAFEYFRIQEVDIAVIEVGLGGRLDSTNVIIPEVSLITNISFDHTDLLGDTLEKIAAEKAGIIKAGVPVVIGSNQPEIQHIFEAKALECQSELITISSDPETIDFPFPYRSIKYQNHTWHLDLPADYYMKNIPGVIETIKVLRSRGFDIDDKAISEGLKSMTTLTGLKGRFQSIGKEPLVITDVSHNEAGIRSLIEQISNLNYKELHVIYGAVKDKLVYDILSIFPEKTHYYFTQSQVPRSMPVSDLLQIAHQADKKGNSFTNVNLALDAAKKIAKPEDLILITGSTFVVAEIKGL
jgi:dihydrofolate synthase/folylpolyglutamate synthase